MKGVILLIFIAMVLSTTNSFAFTLEGNTAIEEIDGIRITVTPHTTTSPVKNYKQNYSFENLNNEDLLGVRAVYYFSQKPKISVQKLIQPVYESIEQSKSFDTSIYQWTYTETGNEQNPYLATVYIVDDSNGLSEKVTVWKNEVKRFSECGENNQEQCFYWNEKQLVKGKNWENVDAPTLLGQVEINGESVWYYYSDEFDLIAGKRIDSKIKYSVPKGAGKWSLGIIKGEPGCLTTSCEKQVVLDPWWEDSDYTYKRQIQFPNQNISTGTEVQVKWDSATELTGIRDDLYDVRIVDYLTETELTRTCYGTATDGDCFFTLPRTISPGENNIYVYYEYNSASAPTYYGVNTNTCGFEDETCDLGTYNGGGSISTDYARFGSKSYKIGEDATVKHAHTKGSLEGTTSDLNYSVWVYVTDLSGIAALILREKDIGDPCNIGMLNLTGNFYYVNYANYPHGTFTNTGVKANINTWYNFQINYQDQSTRCDYAILDEDGKGVWAGWGYTENTQPFNVNQVLMYRTLEAEAYFDELTNGVPLAATLGSEESIDHDGDGIGDKLDKCLATPQGEVVDELGCSCSQKTCDDGNPCTDNSCNWSIAECEFVNNNENVCGFPRDCTQSTCILKEEPPYFFWKAYPDDGQDYCIEGACVQYNCDLTSEDYNAACSFTNTSELEAKVEELEGKVSQLEQQNLALQEEDNLLWASINSLQQNFDNFISLINNYLFNLPKGLRQGMLCGALEQSGEPSADGFGLHCEINQHGKCNCTQL